MILPTSVEPVNATLSTSGCADQPVAGGVAVAGDDVDHAGREAGLGDQVGEAQRGQRRLLGGLEDERAAGGQRRARSSGRHQQREVPRHDLRADADRLARSKRRTCPPGACRARHARRRAWWPSRPCSAACSIDAGDIDRAAMPLGLPLSIASSSANSSACASSRSASFVHDAARAPSAAGRTSGRRRTRCAPRRRRGRRPRRRRRRCGAISRAGRGILDRDRRAVAGIDPFAVDEQCGLRASASLARPNRPAGR